MSAIRIWLCIPVFIGMSAAVCTSTRQDFQRYEPNEYASLADIFDNTPAIKSVFTKIDPYDFNVKAAEFMNHDLDQAVRNFIAVGALIEDVPALPRIFDSLSYDIHQLSSWYIDNDAQFTNGMQVGSRVLSVDPQAVTQAAGVVADVLRYFGDSKKLYASASGKKFPTKSEWARCNDPDGYYEAARPEDLESEREFLLNLYDFGRTLFCLYDGNPPSSDKPGDFILQYLRQYKQSGADPEKTILELSNYIRDNTDKIAETERAWAEWTAADPDKVFITDFATYDFYKLSKKDIIFDKGKPILDRQSRHWSVRNPDKENQYLTTWFLESAYRDAGKLDRLEIFYEPDTDNGIHRFIEDLYDHPEVGLANAIVNNYGEGDASLAREKIIDLVWDGVTVEPEHGPTKDLVGWLCPDADSFSPDYDCQTSVRDFENQAVGYVYKFITARSNDPKIHSLREVLGAAKQNLNGESITEAVLQNLYLHLSDRFYINDYNGTGRGRWLLSAADALEHQPPLDPGDTLPNYIAKVRYTLFNSVTLDRYGEFPPNDLDPDDNGGNINFLSELIYLIAAVNGLVDSRPPGEGGAPGEYTVSHALYYMGAPDSLSANGYCELDCINEDLEFLGTVLPVGFQILDFPNRTFRASYDPSAGKLNHYKYTLGLYSSGFELVQPGQFRPRSGFDPGDGSSVGDWVGRYDGHQGDLYSSRSSDPTKHVTKAATWSMNFLNASAYQGYGPYTVGGKAPNGNELRYQNQWTTDTYWSAWGATGTANLEEMGDREMYGTWCGHTMSGVGQAGLIDPNGAAGDPEPCLSTSGYNGMGANRGATGTASSGHRHGNYLLTEKLYRPMKAGDPCWADAEGPDYGYARYGYERPSSTHADDDAWRDENNCLGWNRVQVDFDTREEAVRKNVTWTINDRKLAVVLPMYMYLNIDDDLCWILPTIGETDCGRGESSSFVIGVSNGYKAFAKLRMPDGGPDYNGCWSKDGSATFLCLPHDQGPGTLHVDNDYLIRETVPRNGADVTFSSKAESFESGEYILLIDQSFEYTGVVADFMDLLDIDNLLWSTLGNRPLLPELWGENFDAVLGLGTIIYEADDIIDTSVFDPLANNFSKFEKFYNRYFGDLGGVPGSADVWESYLLGDVLPGNLGPVPKVNGVSYPDFDASGNITGWSVYDGESEGKFDALVTVLLIALGTLHEDGAVTKDADGNIIRHEYDGFRAQIDSMLNLAAGLNELKRGTDGDLSDTQSWSADRSEMRPQYNPAALLTALTENSPGARDGFLPWLFKHPLLDFNHTDPSREALEGWVGNNITGLFNTTELLNDTVSPAGVAAKDKFRYFLTENAVEDHPDVFPQNYLKGVGGKPINQLKALLNYLRDLTADPDITAAIKKGIESVQRYLRITGSDTQVSVTEDDIDKLTAFLHSKTADGKKIQHQLLSELFRKERPR